MSDKTRSDDVSRGCVEVDVCTEALECFVKTEETDPEVILIYSTISHEENDSDFDPDDWEDIFSDDEVWSDNSTRSEDRHDRTFIIYEKCFRKFLKYYPKCGSLINSALTEEVKNEGTQFHLKLHCINNCEVDWKSQPEMENMKGAGI